MEIVHRENSESMLLTLSQVTNVSNIVNAVEETLEVEQITTWEMVWNQIPSLRFDATFSWLT